MRAGTREGARCWVEMLAFRRRPALRVAHTQGPRDGPPVRYTPVMKTAKDEIQSVLETLPDDVSLDTLLERIRFKAKILHSMAQADRGEGVPHEQVVERLDQWLQSLGRPTLSETSTR